MAKRGRKKKNKIDINIAVVALVLLSILLMILIYTKSGSIGETLSPMLGGIMGFIKYILANEITKNKYLKTGDLKAQIFKQVIEFVNKVESEYKQAKKHTRSKLWYRLFCDISKQNGLSALLCKGWCEWLIFPAR